MNKCLCFARKVSVCNCCLFFCDSRRDNLFFSLFLFLFLFLGSCCCCCCSVDVWVWVDMDSVCMNLCCMNCMDWQVDVSCFRCLV